MNRQLGSICLIAGTAIGSGMLALPMVLASSGVLYSMIIMFCIWLITYYTSLASVELNLQAGQGLALGKLGKLYSGRIAECIGSLSIVILSYSVLIVFIYGGTSIIQKMVESWNGHSYNFELIAIIYTASLVLLLSFSIKTVDSINRILFCGMLMVIGIMIFALLLVMDWSNIPLASHDFSFDSVSLATPVVFTSFAYQTIFAVLFDYCEKDKAILKKACLWGSIIPAITYGLWTALVLIIIYHQDQNFYNQMSLGKIEVGELVAKLSEIANVNYMRMMIWLLSILGIVTSIIGLGIGLVDTCNTIIYKGEKPHHNFVSLLIIFVPSLVIALLIPNAFVKILSFAGMMLVIIAVLMPLYLLKRVQNNALHYPILKHNSLIFLASIAGVTMIVMECINIFYNK